MGEYLSARDKLICELYKQGVGIEEIKTRSGIANIYHTLKIYEIPLRADLRQQLKENVCREFDAGMSMEQIIIKYKINIKTLVNILRDERPKELGEIIEVQKRRQELRRQHIKKKRESELRLQKIELEKQREIARQKKIDREYEEERRLEELEEKKANLKVGNMAHLGGLLGRQEKDMEERRELLDEKHPEREGAHNEMERVLLGRESPVIKQIRDRDIAYDYVKGMGTAELAKKHEVDLSYVAELLETAGEKPKYFPDRPPLDV